MTVSFLLVVGLLAWVFWMSAALAGKEAARSRLSFEARSSMFAEDLRDCLEQGRVEGLGIRRKDGAWQTNADAPAVSFAENPARHMRIEVIEAGDERVLRFYTRDGAALYRSDRRFIDACLADGHA
ncbi:hypothetical protein E5A74_10910 [Sphingomonas naasensis]|uniref:Uncharacterized protein n=1 Tax=Sphingomonas naasensis TaxID=1344951 RepID=A0A4V3QWF5_9SPHN|nr:hypothetical protein [Sphingomonas naasensis]TGX42352.1 hypothetical protein E5A74_10910 [Sphingomonas naasensis]